MDLFDHQKEFNKFHRGKFTASEIHKLMGEKGGITTATAQTYILEKVAEELSDPEWIDDTYKGKAIEWGLMLEPEALEYYSLAFNVPVEKPQSQNAEWSDEVGCSPDGLVYPKDNKVYGLECKCPYYTANHVKHMLLKTEQDLKKLTKDYYWQILMNMLIFGLDYYELISYDPRFIGANRMYVLPFHRHNVEQDIVLLKQNILLALEEKHRIISLINS